MDLDSIHNIVMFELLEHQQVPIHCSPDMGKYQPRHFQVTDLLVNHHTYVQGMLIIIKLIFFLKKLTSKIQI